MKMKTLSKRSIVYVCMIVGLFMLLPPQTALAWSLSPASPLTLAVGDSVTVTASGLEPQTLTDLATGGDPGIATIVFDTSPAMGFTVHGIAPGTTTYVLNTTDGETPYFTIIVTGVIPPPPPPPPPPSVTVTYIAQPSVRPAYEQATVGKCKEWVTIRSGPGTGFEALGKAYLGETIELIQWAEKETWCKVFYNGGKSLGWIHRKFIILAK